MAISENFSNITEKNFYPSCFYENIDFWLPIQTILIFCATIVGLFTNVVYLVAVTQTSLIHPNVRFLLANLGVASLINITYQFFYAVYNSYILHYRDVSFLAIRPFGCALAQTPFLVSALCIIISVACICTERALAMFFGWTDNDNQSSTFGLRLVIAASWILPLSVVTLSVISYPVSYRNYICYCHAVLAVPKEILKGLIGVCITVDILALILCVLVLIWNNHQLNSFGINRATRHSLAQRFQLSNNVETTTALFPVVILHSLGITTTFSVWSYLQKTLAFHVSVGSTNLLLGSHFPTLVFLILFPVVCMAQHRHLNRFVYEKFPRLAPYMAGPRKFPVRRAGRTMSMTAADITSANPVVSFHAGPDDAQLIIDQFWEHTQV